MLCYDSPVQWFAGIFSKPQNHVDAIVSNIWLNIAWQHRCTAQHSFHGHRRHCNGKQKKSIKLIRRPSSKVTRNTTDVDCAWNKYDWAAAAYEFSVVKYTNKYKLILNFVWAIEMSAWKTKIHFEFLCTSNATSKLGHWICTTTIMCLWTR